MTQNYECVLLLDPALPEEVVQGYHDQVGKIVTDAGGEVTHVQKWGKRRLAYEIRKKRDGVYTMIVWNGAGPMVKEVERRLRLNENVMRVLSTLYVPPELSQGVPESEAVAAGAEAGDDD